MSKDIPTKKTFGSVRVNSFSPPIAPETPKALNVIITFEEALRIHLGIGQALAKLNGYDRSTKTGRGSALNLCVYTHGGRITINEAQASEAKGESAVDE